MFVRFHSHIRLTPDERGHSEQLKLPSGGGNCCCCVASSSILTCTCRITSCAWTSSSPPPSSSATCNSFDCRAANLSVIISSKARFRTHSKHTNDKRLTGRLERSRRYDEPLEEDALLEHEPLLQCSRHVGRRDVEGHCDEPLLEDKVDLEVADDAALSAREERH